MKTKPFKHQETALIRLQGKRNYALLMEQGTGKSWSTLADAERCFISDKIDSLIVLAPKGVHTNWIKREISEHLEIDSISVYWKKLTTKKAQKEFETLFDTTNSKPKLRVFTINYDALRTKDGFDAVSKLMNTFRVMLVADESSRIKNPAAQVTKQAIKLSKVATARRILNGTPITKDPADLFSQFEFLNIPLGTTSYRAFVSEYVVLIDPDSARMANMMRARGIPDAVGRRAPQIPERDKNGQKIFKNLDKLRKLIEPHSYRVTQKECLDLPEQIFTNVYFDLDSKQRAIYDHMKEELHYCDDHSDVSFEAISARSKLRQITSGFVKIQDRMVYMDKNPRLDAIKDYIEEVVEDRPFIVWCLFLDEVKAIKQFLESSEISCATYIGENSNEERDATITGFQSGKIQCIIANSAAASGITLTRAWYNLYYSSNEDAWVRWQSLFRSYRIGLDHPVVNVDFIASDTLDEKTVLNLQTKKGVADEVIDGLKRNSIDNSCQGKDNENSNYA